MSGHTFLHEGPGIQLDIVHADATGIEWFWTGSRDNQGEPLLQSATRDHDGPLPVGRYDQAPVPLSVVYWLYGPLMPLPTHLRRPVSAHIDQPTQAVAA